MGGKPPVAYVVIVKMRLMAIDMQMTKLGMGEVVYEVWGYGILVVERRVDYA